MRWRKVEDELPPNNKEVLIYRKCKKYVVASYDDQVNGWSVTCSVIHKDENSEWFYHFYDVIYWTLLPEAPKKFKIS